MSQFSLFFYAAIFLFNSSWGQLLYLLIYVRDLSLVRVGSISEKKRKSVLYCSQVGRIRPRRGRKPTSDLDFTKVYWRRTIRFLLYCIVFRS